jgi:hypothetical protein
MDQCGQGFGAEEWGKRSNTVLGPTINIDRDPRWGRSFKSLSEAPCLAAQVAAVEIQGIRSQGPMVQVKHFVVDNQETYRNTFQGNLAVSDRADREMYLPAFESAADQGKADSVMCSYVMVNDTFAGENGQLLNMILKGQMEFTGFVTSDWGSANSTVASANNGLDQERTKSTYYGAALITAVDNGQGLPSRHRRSHEPHHHLDVRRKPFRQFTERHDDRRGQRRHGVACAPERTACQRGQRGGLAVDRQPHGHRRSSTSSTTEPTTRPQFSDWLWPVDFEPATQAIIPRLLDL